jgi:hypothetical protein
MMWAAIAGAVIGGIGGYFEAKHKQGPVKYMYREAKDWYESYKANPWQPNYSMGMWNMLMNRSMGGSLAGKYGPQPDQMSTLYPWLQHQQEPPQQQGNPSRSLMQGPMGSMRGEGRRA